MNKKAKRIRRAKRKSESIKKLGREKNVYRLIITKSSKHISAQVIEPVGGKVVAGVSSMSMKDEKGTKSEVAAKVGKALAEKVKPVVTAQIACDTSGHKYHGRVAALVTAMREVGVRV